MTRRIAIPLVCLLLVGFTTTGCIGRMALSGKVRAFNLETTDSRWGREGWFLLLQPVYSIASMADVFYANAVEFWSGTNPINGEPSITPIAGRRVLEAEDGSILAMTPREDGSIDVELETAGGERHVVNLVPTFGGFAARNASWEPAPAGEPVF